MITHLACIMDGNRRFAKQHGWLPWLGHREGLKAAERVIAFCITNNISYLSLYTFSAENFRRPVKELNYLFNTIVPALNNANNIAKLQKQGVRICFIGDRTLFPKSIRPLCQNIEQETAQGDTLQVNLLFCYSGRQEIVGGIKQLIKQVKAGILQEEQLDEQTIAKQLWTGHLPPPDLIVRTGGIQRLSGFFLYQAAYSELYFLDCLWPEITDAHLHEALNFFKTTQRNFGT